jgi:hypothetical protein
MLCSVKIHLIINILNFRSKHAFYKQNIPHVPQALIQLKEIDDEDLMDVFRGSSDIPAQFDMIYGIFRGNNVVSNNTRKFDVSVLEVKNREGLPFQDFSFEVMQDDNDQTTKFNFVGFKRLMKVVDRIYSNIIDYLKEEGEKSRSSSSES